MASKAVWIASDDVSLHRVLLGASVWSSGFKGVGGCGLESGQGCRHSHSLDCPGKASSLAWSVGRATRRSLPMPQKALGSHALAKATTETEQIAARSFGTFSLPSSS